MKRLLLALLLLPSLAWGQKTPINGVAGPTTSDQLRGIITNPTGTGSSVFAISPGLITPDIGAATGLNVNIQRGLVGEFEGAVFKPDLFGWGSTAGAQAWTTSSHPAFGVMQTTLPYNETELQIYTNLANGIATRVNGTNQLTYTSGTAFAASFAQSGLANFYLDGVAYIVLTANASTVTVKNANGTAVTWGSNNVGTYYYGGLTATNTCTVAGGVNATTSPGNGTPFFGLSSPAVSKLFIDGVAQPSFTYNSNSSVTLGSSVANGTHTCIEYGVLDNQISKVALQGLQGSSEEAFVMSLRPDGVQLAMQYAGSGQYRSIKIWDGEFPAGTKQFWLDIEPSTTLGSSGTMSLGGLLGSEMMKFDPSVPRITANAVFNSTVGYSANGVAGISTTATVRNSAGSGTCALTFTLGLLTGSTC